MKFKSSNSFLSKIIFLIIPILLMLLNLFSYYKNGFSLMTVLWPIYILIMLSMYFNTYYIIDKERLYYKSGFVHKGSIEIKSIYKIIKVKRFYVGNKPALTSNGLLLCYNKYDDIFISPESLSLFIDTVTSLNPKVKVEI
jgi:hypothetical protein